MRSLGRQRLGAFVAVAAALVIVGGGVAWATIPGDDGVITACMGKAGTIRLIDPGVTSCRQSETQVAWNVAGQPGSPGSGGAAVYTTWDGSGGNPGDYKELDNGAVTTLVELTVPEGFDSGSVVATATVWISNQLEQDIWGSCGVWRQSGDEAPWQAGWPFTLSVGRNLLSFQVEVDGTGPLQLKCSLETTAGGNPAANELVWAEGASLSAVPVATS